jgi:hypothetical protein
MHTWFTHTIVANGSVSGERVVAAQAPTQAVSHRPSSAAISSMSQHHSDWQGKAVAMLGISLMSK